MPNDKKEKLLQQISNWSIGDVVSVLQKNKLSECCKAVEKRQVNGEELLHLSEGKINLWKNDLTRSLRWSLCRFVEELINNPQQYCPEEDSPTPRSSSPDHSDAYSGSEQWDTDFEEDEPSRSAGKDSSYNENSNNCPEMYRHYNSPPQSRTDQGISGNKMLDSAHEVEEDDNIYANEPEVVRPSKSPVNVTSNGIDIVTQLQEQLLHMHRLRKPILPPKPKVMEKTPEVVNQLKAKAAFLHSQQPLRPQINPDKTTPSCKSTKTNEPPRMQKPKKYVLPPNPKNAYQISLVSDEKLKKLQDLPRDLPKPPSSPLHIGKLDLVEKADDSDEYDYETIKGQIEKHQNLKSMNNRSSTQSSVNGRSTKNSNESVYHPLNSSSSVEDNQDVYEIIPDKADDRDTYVKPICNRYAPTPTMCLTLPPRPSPISNLQIGRQLLGGLGSRLADEVADMIVRIKRGLLRCCHGQPSESPETLEPPKPPAARRQASLSECLTKAALTQARENLAKRPETAKYHTVPSTASRPLPPPPPTDISKPDRVEIPDRNFDAPSYMEKPWFHNIGREEAISRIEKGTGSSTPDGYFLVRPSNANMNQPWTLVLWYKNKTYNIAIRKRPDFKYALGKVKPNEQPFASIEEMISYYHQEELVLNSGSGDAQVGWTRLTGTPPK